MAETDRMTELLLLAVRQLGQDEQDEVLALLLGQRVSAAAADAPPDPPVAAPRGLGRRLGSSSLSWPVPSTATRTGLFDRLGRAEGAFMTGPDSGDLKVLPVRLPTADYERLREWSRGHGFSMAVIIRTLVERFLDDQQRRTGDVPNDLDPDDPEAAGDPTGTG
jgi:hypothetical protein